MPSSEGRIKDVCRIAPPSQIRASGGGIASPLWRQILADVLGFQIATVTTTEGAAYGAALLGGVAAGVFADVHEAVAATVRVQDTVEPEPEWVRPYADGYRRFRSLYPALRPLEDE